MGDRAPAPVKTKRAAESAGFRPIERATIGDLRALRTVSDVHRHRLLTLLIGEALSARELASRLRMPRAKTYYHLKLLLRAAFIVEVEDRIVGRRVETVYRARALNWRVDESLIGRSGKAVTHQRARLLEGTVEDLRTRLDAASSERALVARKFARMSAAELARLRHRLREVFESIDASQKSGDLVEVALAVFPIREP